MAPLNTRTAAVVDVILSNHARGYRNGEMISHELFPRAPVGNRSMKTVAFGKESFRKVNTRRAPGGLIKRLQFGYEGVPIGLAQDSLAGLVPQEHKEEAASVPGIDLGSTAVSTVLDILDLNLEIEAAEMATDPARYGDNNKLVLTGTDKWSDPASDPEEDMNEAKDNVRRMIGRYPNVLALSAKAFKALKRQPKIKDQFKYVSSKSITAEMLASFFDLEKVVVGKAVWLPENAADTEMANDVWGNDAVLAFVPNSATGNFMIPSFGYCYEMAGYPQVEQPRYDGDYRSWIYPTTVERRPHLVGAEGGFVFKDVT